MLDDSSEDEGDNGVDVAGGGVVAEEREESDDDLDAPLPDDLSQLTLPQLKQLCRDRSLPSSGNKQALVDRLQKFVPGEQWQWQDDVPHVAAPALDQTSHVVLGSVRGTQPIDFFDAVFPLSLVDLMATETNRYATQKGHIDTGYRRPTDRSELYRFLGVLLYMGIVRCTAVADYFPPSSTNLPVVSNVFGFNRFRWLEQHLHLVDNEAPPQCPAVVQRVWPMVQTLRQSFETILRPGSLVTIDESIVAYKGRHAAVQFFPQKPIRFGIKFWTVVDCRTLWITTFDVFGGKGAAVEDDEDEPADSDGTDTDQLVLRLVDRVPKLGHHGRRVYIVDNFFTSIKLFIRLKDLGAGAMGTVRPRRLFIADKDFKAKTKALQYGQSAFARRDPGLVLSLWREKKVVSMLSTEHVAGQVVHVKRLDKTTMQGRDVEAPAAVRDYNASMGAVDRVNSAINTRTPIIRFKRNWLKIFLRLHLMACWNAHCLYRLALGTSELAWRGFLSQLADELIARGSPPSSSSSDDQSHRMQFGAPEHACIACGRRTTMVCSSCGATCKAEPIVYDPGSLPGKRPRSSST